MEFLTKLCLNSFKVMEAIEIIIYYYQCYNSNIMLLLELCTNKFPFLKKSSFEFWLFIATCMQNYPYFRQQSLFCICLVLFSYKFQQVANSRA